MLRWLTVVPIAHARIFTSGDPTVTPPSPTRPGVRRLGTEAR